MHFGPVSGPNRELFVNWLASIRGRAGVAMGAIGPAQSVYLYGTGGIAFTEFGVASSPGAPGGPGRRSDTFTRVGWTIGAGVEALVTDKVSVKTEFLHMDFGASNLNVPRFDATPTRLSVNSIRLGVNVHF